MFRTVVKQGVFQAQTATRVRSSTSHVAYSSKTVAEAAQELGTAVNKSLGESVAAGIETAQQAANVSAEAANQSVKSARESVKRGLEDAQEAFQGVKEAGKEIKEAVKNVDTSDLEDSAAGLKEEAKDAIKDGINKL